MIIKCSARIPNSMEKQEDELWLFSLVSFIKNEHKTTFIVKKFHFISFMKQKTRVKSLVGHGSTKYIQNLFLFNHPKNQYNQFIKSSTYEIEMSTFSNSKCSGKQSKWYNKVFHGFSQNKKKVVVLENKYSTNKTTKQ